MIRLAIFSANRTGWTIDSLLIWIIWFGFENNIFYNTKMIILMKFSLDMFRDDFSKWYSYLIAVNLMIPRSFYAAADEVCYKILPNVPCDFFTLGSKCLTKCIELCGRSISATCLKHDVCACNYISPNCTKNRKCWSFFIFSNSCYIHIY